jgi:cullin 1
MCTQRSPYNWSRELYQRHGETIQHYLTSTVLPALQEKANQQGTGGSVGGGATILLLQELHLRWNNHLIMNKWLKKFFTYLDRYYVKHHSLPTLEQAGLRCFRTQIYDEIKQETTAAILTLINNEREGHIVDKTLIRSIIELYESMGMGTLDTYNNDFETELLTNTNEFYIAKQTEWITSDSTPDYLIKAEEAYANERTRISDYLNSSTESKLLKVLDAVLLESVETVLIEKEMSGLRVLLHNDKSEDIQRMFRLFQRLDNGLPPISTIVQEFITSRGDDIINRRQSRIDSLKDGEKEKCDDPTFIKSIIELHEKYLLVIKKDFNGHSLFQKALKDAFVEIINKNIGAYTNAELMSSYCDRLLKSGTTDENEIELNLGYIVQLFSYLSDKDLFAEIYRNQLAKRLLNNNKTGGGSGGTMAGGGGGSGGSGYDDLEKLMIAKLKVQCGTQFTSKMEGMLADLLVGQQQRIEFENRLRTMQSSNCDGGSTTTTALCGSGLKIDFSVQVLTTGFWPTYKSPDVTMSDEMSKCLSMYKEWHKQQHQTRKLQWITTQGNATVKGSFARKVYDLQVSTLQAIALVLFNDGVTYTTEELIQKLNLDETIVKPLMHSLSCGKAKVLLKSPASNKISNTDKFTSNSKFVSNLRKIRIPMASLESSFNTAKVEEDRTILIEAAIVRIMKARKTLQHQQLVAEVLSQLRFFSPNPRLVKKRIESLIDREYLERSSDNSSAYNYLA